MSPTIAKQIWRNLGLTIRHVDNFEKGEYRQQFIDANGEVAGEILWFEESSNHRHQVYYKLPKVFTNGINYSR